MHLKKVAEAGCSSSFIGGIVRLSKLTATPHCNCYCFFVFLQKIKEHMTLTPLSAISPIDGRYRNTTAELAAYFSEYALIKYRVFVEIEYFIALCEHPLPQLQKFDKNVAEKLRDIVKNFSEAD